MARIRSIHPKLFTDESYMALGHAAARFLFGLWTEADDHGVFEWKPITLKARILPAHGDDINSLLAELVSNNILIKFDQDGRSYGLIRNFCKYQKPKKPTYSYPLPNQYRTYAGLKDEGSPPVPRQSTTTTESSFQREEGGGRREEIKGVGEEEGGIAPLPEKNGEALSLIQALDKSIIQHYGENQARMSPSPLDLITAQRWLDAGCTVQVCSAVIENLVARQKAKGGSPPKSLSYFDSAVGDAATAIGSSRFSAKSVYIPKPRRNLQA